jgi:tetratricopeptide (TPR) repeat protein
MMALSRISWLVAGLTLSVLSRGFSQGQAQNADSLRTYFTPENVLRFADFLFDQGDYERAACEYERYRLSGWQEKSDYVAFQLGRCELRMGRPERAAAWFLEAMEETHRGSLADSARFGYLCARMRGDKDLSFPPVALHHREKIGDGALKCRASLLVALYYLDRGQWQEAREAALQAEGICGNGVASESLARILKLAHRGEAPALKSPEIAAALSLLVPGAGKLYVGRRGDALYSFLVVTTSSWLAYEGFHQQGRKSLKGWIFGGATVFFHFGNVYGSAVAARVHNEGFCEELRRAIRAEVDRHCRF